MTNASATDGCASRCNRAHGGCNWCSDNTDIEESEGYGDSSEEMHPEAVSCWGSVISMLNLSKPEELDVEVSW